MYEEIIQDTKRYLIEQYGDPVEKHDGNMTVRTINTYLDSFTRFINSLDQLLDTLDIKNVDPQMKLICEYAKTAEYVDLDYINTKLKAIQRQLKKGNSNTSIINLFNDLGTIATNSKTNPKIVMNYFRYYLGNSMYKLNIRSDRYNYTRRDEYDTNLAFQDNNL